TSTSGAPNFDAACISAARIASGAVTCPSWSLFWTSTWGRRASRTRAARPSSIVGLIEARPLEDYAAAERDLSLGPLAALGALGEALGRDPGRSLFKDMP